MSAVHQGEVIYTVADCCVGVVGINIIEESQTNWAVANRENVLCQFARLVVFTAASWVNISSVTNVIGELTD